MRNRGIGRARMFMGALLLLAAMLTWGIGLMMSPHGETVAQGTEYLRGTIVTFKRNGAVGTLILCAVAAWLLFPRRRPKWPTRDWGLIALLAFLAATSIYTLVWLRPVASNTLSADENLVTADMNLVSNASGTAADRQAANMSEPVAPPDALAQREPAQPAARKQSGNSSAAQDQADSARVLDIPGDTEETANNEMEGNQEQPQ